MADTPAVLINGARQTGKSTLVQSAELTRQGRQYLTFDDPGVLAAAKRDPNGFVAGLNAPVTLDEVQHVPELFPVIKGVIDRKREAGRFLLTGSANVMVLPKLSESLAGRVVGIEIKASATLGGGDVRGLQAMAAAMGARWVCGVVLYTGTQVIPFAANLHGLPVSHIWAADGSTLQHAAPRGHVDAAPLAQRAGKTRT